MDLVSQADKDLLNEIEQEIKRNKVLLLLRGCPGSGKTTLANWLKRKLWTHNVDILSTNDHFEDSMGVYRHNNASLRKAYKDTTTMASELMKKESILIIIDDKNIKYWEMSPYLDMAQEYSYTVKIAVTNTPWRSDPAILAEKNVHGVNANRIKKMLDDFQPFTVDDISNLSKDGKKMSTQKRKASLEENEVPQKSLVMIMEEEKKNEISFREKYAFTDNIDFTKLCQTFYHIDRQYLAEVFKDNRFNLDRTIWLLKNKEEKEVGMTRIVMSSCELPVAKRPQKLAPVINYEWLQINKILITFDVMKRELTRASSIYKTFMYRTKMSNDMSIGDKARWVIDILLDLKADTAKNRIKRESYNEVDMHLMNWSEAAFIFDEAFHDYNEAARDHPDMKGHVKFITGKGLHSKNGKPVLRPKLEEYLKTMHIKYAAHDGFIKVYKTGHCSLAPKNYREKKYRT